VKQFRKNTAKPFCASLAVLVLAVPVFSVGSRGNTPLDDPPTPYDPDAPLPSLTANDVDQIKKAAVNAAYAVAVTDRQGDILAVYRKASAPATVTANFGIQANATDVAAALARTAGAAIAKPRFLREQYVTSAASISRPESCSRATPLCTE